MKQAHRRSASGRVVALQAIRDPVLALGELEARLERSLLVFDSAGEPGRAPLFPDVSEPCGCLGTLCACDGHDCAEVCDVHCLVDYG